MKIEKKQKSFLQKYKIIIIFLTFITFLLSIKFWIPDYEKKIYYQIKKILKKDLLTSFLFLSFLNIFFQLLFFPGVSATVIFLGYITKSFIKSFLLIFSSTILAVSLSYFIIKYFLKSYVYDLLKDKWYFLIYKEESKNFPLKISFMIRILMIPVSYKNYILAIFDVGFFNFFLPSFIYYFFYLPVYILIGLGIDNIIDLFDKKIPEDDLVIYYFFLGFVGTMVLLTAFVFFYIAKITKDKYRIFMEKSKKNKNKKNN